MLIEGRVDGKPIYFKLCQEEPMMMSYIIDIGRINV